MAIHELRYWDISGSSCSGGTFAFYPFQVDWIPEQLGYDLQSRPIYGNFYEVHWLIDAALYANSAHPDGVTTQGGWTQLDTFFQSGSPLCLRTVPKGSITPETFTNVYMLKPMGTRVDLNTYDIEVIFIRVEPS